MAGLSERDYDRLVEKYGQPLVDEAEDAFAALQASEQDLRALQSSRMQADDDRAIERARRRVERIEERIAGLVIDQRHGALREMMSSHNPQWSTAVEARIADDPQPAIQLGHTVEQQLRYASSARSAAVETASRQPIPGSPQSPIQIGHTVEQQLRYARGRSGQRRTILDKAPDDLALFEQLYADVVRTADGVPIGSLHRHAEGRLQQSYAVLMLIEQARKSGILPEDGEVMATGARVQDKSTSRDYPAAHRLPCDVSIKYQGETIRLADYFESGLDRTWIDKHVFAPTDRMHRLANVVDQWCEDAGMKKALVEASNAVLHNRMDARRAMEEIVQPGYAEAIATARRKVERNFSFLERQALSRRVLGADALPSSAMPEPQALRVKDLASRVAAKEVVERTLAAYGEVRDLPPDLRVRSARAVSGIIDNERQFGAAATNRGRILARGAARVEGELATRDARRRMAEEMDPIKKLAAKAKQASLAANDISRPMSSRLRALDAAGAYSDKMKIAWMTLQQDRGPKILSDMRSRLDRCDGDGEVQFAQLKSTLAAPPRFVTDVARQVEDSREALLNNDRLEQERRRREGPERLSGPDYSQRI